MITHLRGDIIEKSPAHMVIECGGIGYYVNISVNTYSKFQKQSKGLVLTHMIVREDAHTLYGFADESEREMFKKLISVSGVGASTARMMLSSLTVNDLVRAIVMGSVDVLKGVKGIGAKSAQRIIVDLKDKLDGVDGSSADISLGVDNTNKNEALSALVSLGFDKKAADKVLSKLISDDPDLAVEVLIKEGLKSL